MKKLLIVFVLAAVGYLAYSLTTTGREAPTDVRAVMPGSVMWYAEARDLTAVWSEVGKTEAWKDLEESTMVAIFLQQELTRTLLQRLEDISKEIDYPINDENLLKFLGTELAIGATIQEGREEPDFILATRLNTAAITQDFLLGDANWLELQKELERRSEAAKVEVTSTEVTGGYVLTTLTLPGESDESLHAVLLEDVLCLSTSRDLVLEAVATLLHAESKSIQDLASFNQEIAALRPDHLGFDWLNFEALKTARPQLVAMAKNERDAVGMGGFVDGLLEAVEGCPSLARSWSLPNHDLYQVTWEYSRTPEEIFGQLEALPIGDYAVQDPLLLFEATRLGDLVDQMSESEAWSQSAASAGVASIMEQVNEAALMGLLADGGELPADFEGSYRFEQKMFELIISRQMDAFFDGDMHFSGTLSESAENPFVWMTATRLGVDGLFLVHGAMGAVAHEEYAEAVNWDGVKALILPLGDQGKCALALHGNTLLWGSVDQVKAVLARDSAPANDQVAQVRSRFEAGHYAFGYMDARQVLDNPAFAGSLPPEMAQMMDSFVGPFYAGAFYIKPGFEAVEFQMLVGVPEGLDVAPSFRSEPPLLCDYLPESTIGSAVSRVDVVQYLAVFEKLLANDLGDQSEEKIEGGMQAISDFLQVDFENELLPALGHEFGYALIFSDEPLEELGGMPIPGIVFAIEVQDEPVVQRVLDTLFDAGNESLGRDGYPMRLVDQSGTIVLDSDEGALPVRPAMDIVDGLLLIASDESVLDEMRAVKAGERAGMVATPMYQRAMGMEDPSGAEGWAFMDVPRFFSQFELYKSAFATVMPNDVPFPEFPDDADEEEWDRRMAAWEAERAKAAEESVAKIDEALSSLAIYQFVSVITKREGDALRSRMILGLVK